MLYSKTSFQVPSVSVFVVLGTPYQGQTVHSLLIGTLLRTVHAHILCRNHILPSLTPSHSVPTSSPERGTQSPAICPFLPSKQKVFMAPPSSSSLLLSPASCGRAPRPPTCRYQSLLPFPGVRGGPSFCTNGFSRVEKCCTH